MMVVSSGIHSFAMTETQIISKKIRPYLQELGFRVFKTHGNAFTETGTPDLLCCHAGRFFAFEVKKPSNKPTAVQLIVLKTIREAGGVAEVIHTDTFKEEIQRALACVDTQRSTI